MGKHPTFVHLTDLHIGDPDVVDEKLYSDTSATLARILQDVKRLQPAPDFIVASGDLTNRGDLGSYAELKRIFAEAALDIPVVWALGNHDTRPGFYQGMLGRTDDLSAPYDHDQVIAGLHVITLDSSRPHRIGGFLDATQLDWLAATLAVYPDLPKLIVCHHPPSLDEYNVAMEWEAISCADTIRLRETLAGHNVIGMLSGHIHFDRVSHWCGFPVVVGIGQHAATDVLALHAGLRMVSGASFAVGTVRPSGLTIAFVPQPAERRELKYHSFADMLVLIATYEERRLAALAAG